MKSRKIKPEFENIKALGEWHVASIWFRSAAQTIDHLFVGFACAFIMGFWFSQKALQPRWWLTLALLWMVVSITMQIIFTVTYKNTPGKRALGLTVLSTRPNQPLTFNQVITRTFVWWLGFFTLGTGWCTILTRPDRRAWHDVAAETMVVNRGGVATYGTPTQKKLGEAWLSALASGFGILILGLLFIELQKLHELPTTTASLNSVASIDDILKQVEGDGEYKTQEANLIQKIKDLSVIAQEADGSTNTPSGKANDSANGATGDAATSVTRSAVDSTQDLYLYKAALAHLMIKGGHLNDAWLTVSEDVQNIRKQNRVSEMARPLIEVACAAEAFNTGTVSHVELCTRADFWQAWNLGAKAKKEPMTYTSAGEVLGYWWSLAQNISQTGSEKIETVDHWDAARNNFHGDLELGLPHDIAAALDFVLNIRNSNPTNLVEKSKAIGPQNLLWAWAQKQALKKYGSQWGQLVSPAEQQNIAHYNLLRVAQREIASEKQKIKSSEPAPAQ